jgi:NADPH:quinone reductase-like Zn-dependent oxidoreductase
MSISLPKKMHAVLLLGHGGMDKLCYKDDIELPRMGDNDVLIRVRAAGVNNTDINTRIGWYSKSVSSDTSFGSREGLKSMSTEDASWSGIPLEFPRIQGADVCGHIVDVGRNVSRARIGERVLARTMMQDPENPGRFQCWTMGSECDGGFAQYNSTRSSEVYAIKSNWSDIELASIPCAYSTAENMLHRVGLGKERVLITGASGGVGSAAIQLASLRGAEIIAQANSNKAERLKEIGANQVIDRDSNLLDEIEPSSIDVVVDLVAGPIWQSVLDVLKSGGRYIASGAIAGPIVELDIRTLYLKDITLMGATYQDKICFENLISYIEQGALKPLIAKTFPLTEIKQAQEMFLEKQFIGKIVLEIP